MSGWVTTTISFHTSGALCSSFNTRHENSSRPKKSIRNLLSCSLPLVCRQRDRSRLYPWYRLRRKVKNISHVICNQNCNTSPWWTHIRRSGNNIFYFHFLLYIQEQSLCCWNDDSVVRWRGYWSISDRETNKDTCHWYLRTIFAPQCSDQ